jgi:hypothetical protein
MPRRPAKIERNVPLYLIPGIVKREVSSHGERLKRVIVRQTRGHFYNISIRTKPIKKELRSACARCGTGEPIESDNKDTRPDDGSGGERE